MNTAHHIDAVIAAIDETIDGLYNQLGRAQFTAERITPSTESIRHRAQVMDRIDAHLDLVGSLLNFRPIAPDVDSMSDEDLVLEAQRLREEAEAYEKDSFLHHLGG